MGHQADTASYYWTTSLRLDPKLATAFNRGLAYEGKGRYNRAVADYNEAIAWFSPDVRLWPKARACVRTV
jgi:tetratricopeptide (TPR) repeat protein